MGPVELEIVAAPQPLRPFVRRYLYANSRLPSPLIFRPKPTGYTYFSHIFGHWRGHTIRIGSEQFERAARRYLFGQVVDHDVSFRVAEAAEMLVCELTPTAHHRLFGISGPAIVGIKRPLADIAPQQESLARDYFVLGPEASRCDHMAEANAYFARLAAAAAPADPIVEGAVSMFDAADGAIRVIEVARSLGISPRELNRRFTRIVGLSPKFFGQVLQINRAIDLLYADRTGSFAEVACEAGFCDQSHLNRAMRRFFREPPSEFLRSDHYALKTFGAASRRPDSAPPEPPDERRR